MALAQKAPQYDYELKYLGRYSEEVRQLKNCSFVTCREMKKLDRFWELRRIRSIRNKVQLKAILNWVGQNWDRTKY